MMFPLVIFPQFLFAKILSIGVAELAAVYFSWFINRWNGRIALYKVTKNSLVKLHVSALRRFMLKSPIM